MQFTAPVVRGSGRGATIGFPTINLDTQSVPSTLQHGMYACVVSIDNIQHKAVMHFGERPTFDDSLSCEVHVIDQVLESPPRSVYVDVHQKLRDVQSFSSKDDLVHQIHEDIEQAKKL